MGKLIFDLMKNTRFEGNWESGQNKVKMDLPVMLFQEEKTHIAYIPVLDLCGYGNTETEAFNSLQVAIGEYLLYATRKNTLIEDLKSHGWTIKKKNKPFIAPEITDLINKNEYLHDIVNTKPYRMDRLPVEMPAFA
jgi:hypothetical protein